MCKVCSKKNNCQKEKFYSFTDILSLSLSDHELLDALSVILFQIKYLGTMSESLFVCLSVCNISVVTTLAISLKIDTQTELTFPGGVMV